ncbi:GroES-like protein [Calocera viscosa TUFC12733]|uniref:GroES-like protein n=1 Tax=Calocera viscosa (strain TUFC12733) TaxID=1330018 RepID=A0A167NL55_CALVF|nr:GroES-like protein [Calocera viscosa TUFC12733]
MPPQTMKALIQIAYGEPSQVLKVLTVPLPAFDESSDELLLCVKAVSVNPPDYLIVRGVLKFVWAQQMPAGVGVDLSAVVVKAGKRSGYKEGDEVIGCMPMQARRSIAEYCVISSQYIALKPKSLSHEEASCLPVVGLTAIEAFRRHSGPKDTAFIPAGLGGQHIRDVDVVIDYKKVDPATAIPAGSCDFVLEQFGKAPSYVRYMRKPARGSTGGKPSIISIATPPNAEKAQQGWGVSLPFHIRVLLNLWDAWTRFWIPGWIHYDSFFAVANSEDLKALADLADQGKLKPVIDKVFPLDQAVEALALAESKPAGKVVIRISD